MSENRLESIDEMDGKSMSKNRSFFELMFGGKVINPYPDRSRFAGDQFRADNRPRSENMGQNSRRSNE
jgi:hypothetical protein